MKKNILEVENLSVSYRVAAGYSKVVDDVSFAICEGEYFGLVGESGCGKSTVGKALLRLLPDDAALSGSVLLNRRDILKIAEAQMRALRWTELAVITQSSMNALNPVVRISRQFTEIYRLHDPKCSGTEIDARASALFELVGISPKRLNDYPHQLSGGMKQRVVIAMAFALNPDLVIADEPTTALDVIVQDQILGRIEKVHKQIGKSMMLITHDMGLVAENCDRGAVMYAGQIVECGDVRSLFNRPWHPYSMGLRNAFPSLGASRPQNISISGAPPARFDGISGCRFAARCPFRTDLCDTAPPPLVEVGAGHFSRCHYPDRAVEFRSRAKLRSTWRMAGEPA